MVAMGWIEIAPLISRWRLKAVNFAFASRGFATLLPELNLLACSVALGVGVGVGIGSVLGGKVWFGSAVGWS
jgi:hypothetical protein